MAKFREQDILEMMEERLDRDPYVLGALHYSVGNYSDLSGEPYEKIMEENPELPEQQLMYW